MNASTSSIFNFTGSQSGDQMALPDPYVLYSSTQMPVNIENVLRLCEHIWLTSGQYKMAMQRISRYFLTKIVFDGPSDKEKQKYEEFFNDVLHINTLLAELADDFLCYGNSFTSMYMPFNRILICDRCSLTRNINNISENDVTLDLSALCFNAVCPRCGTKTKHKHKDLRSLDQDRIKVIRWNPHEIRLLHSFISGETDYLWNITPEIKGFIRQSKPFWLRHMPWEFIETAAKDALLRYKKGTMYHMKEPVIAGVRNRGWGIPRMLAAYKDIYYIQILKRFNEALALDYIVPFRLISPAKATAADPLLQYDLASWTVKIKQMLEEHRRDPAGWHTVPFPVNYQVLGGEGQTLSPWQLIKQGTSDMLDSLGVPIELFQGTLSLQSAPTALRLFESSWPHLTAALNGWINWLMKRLSDTFNWEPATAKLQPVHFADDLDRRNVMLQLASAQQISKQTAFSPLGVDPDEENRRMLEESSAQQDAQKEFEESQSKQQQLEETLSAQQQPMAGGMAPMGMPMGAGAPAQPMEGTPGMMMPGQPMPGAGMSAATPQELLSQAESMASQLMAMPETARKSQLITLKRQNPVLHAQVRQLMTNMEQAAATQGVAQMRQSAQAGAPM